MFLMKILKNFLVITSLLITSQLGFAESTPNPTEVITFKASKIKKPVKKGHCWTQSLAAPREGAWRCMIGNSIQDPCFSTSDPKIVICDINPAKGESGFAMKLTKPLPDHEKTQESRPFQLQLTDGTLCQPFTGTLTALKGKAVVTYGCTPAECCKGKDFKQGIISIDKSKPQWVAKIIVYAMKNGKVIVKTTRKIPVEKAWK
jgi:hypothetical protein